jgi:fibronectin-binding autotransporter adhesin
LNLTGAGGTLVLTGANDYTGATLVASGTVLRLGNGGTTGSLSPLSDITVQNGGRFSTNRSDTITQGVDFGLLTGGVQGGVIVDGTGTTVFNLANTFTAGGTMSAGTVVAASNGALGTGGNGGFSITGGSLHLKNDITMPVGITTHGEAVASDTAGSIMSTGTNSLSGTVSFGNAGGNISNIVSLSGTLTANGGLSASATGRTFNFGGAGNTVVAGAITGDVSVSKSGAGTTTLTTATNTYTGATTVNGGKLVVNGSVSTSIVTVAPGAVIAGSGSLGGNLIVSAGGQLAPGNSPGNLTLGNGLTLAGSYAWELGALSTANPGADYDIVTVTAGNVDITGAQLQLNLGALAPSANPFWQTDQTWTGIINDTGAGTLTGAFATIDNSAWSSLGAFSTTNTGNDVNLVWKVVPEPASTTSAALAGVLMLLYPRRATRQ